MINFVTPASGKVTAIHTKNGVHFISIFLGIFDNHTQYLPLTAKCVGIKYKPGTFHPAYMFVKSFRNEQNSVDFISAQGKFRITQIAGMLAKRIVNRAKIGNTYKQGTPYGEILFGSRVDIILPDTFTLTLKQGDMLDAGKTVIAIIL